jgi:hypothetical protein
VIYGKMNINPKIEEAFKDFTVGGEVIPIFFTHYEGKAEKYLTYYTWAEQAKNFADNSSRAVVCFGTIDVWSSKNYKDIVEAAVQTLELNNFTWTDNGAELFEPDSGYYHVPINFYIPG